jgi:hypothetical protein
MSNACSAVSKKASLSCAARLPSCKAFISSNRLIDWPVSGPGCQDHYPGVPAAETGAFHTAELEGAKLSGEIEMDESYFGGTRKGQCGRGARGKSIVFGLLERDGRVYTKAVESVSAQTLLTHIENHTRKGSVYYTDAS